MALQASLPFAPLFPVTHAWTFFSVPWLHPPSVLQELLLPGVQSSIPWSLPDITAWLPMLGDKQTKDTRPRKSPSPPPVQPMMLIQRPRLRTSGHPRLCPPSSSPNCAPGFYLFSLLSTFVPVCSSPPGKGPLLSPELSAASELAPGLEPLQESGPKVWPDGSASLQT